MTLAGLNTVNLSELNTFQQVILFILLLLGSAIWVSIWVVHVRRKAFERKFKSIVAAARQRRRERSNSRSSRTRGPPSLPPTPGNPPTEQDDPAVRGRTINAEKRSSTGRIKEKPQSERGDRGSPNDGDIFLTSDPGTDIESNAEGTGTGDNHSTAVPPLSIDVGVSRRITFASPTSPMRERQHGRLLAMQGVGARHDINNHPLRTPPPRYPNEPPRENEHEAAEESTTRHGFLPYGLMGRNSQFAGLTLAERERLGGVEYRAVTILAFLVPAYFVLWQAFGCIGLGAYVAYNRKSATVVNAENPWWVKLDFFHKIVSTDHIQVGWCVQCSLCLQQQRNEFTGRQHGRISDIDLYAHHHGSFDPGRQYLLPRFSQADHLDDI